MAITVNHIEKLPIFVGLAPKDLEQIVQNTHFIMHHYKKGAMIMEEGAPCNALTFITKGWAYSDTYSDDRTYHMVERLEGPQAIEPDKLFGLHCYCQSSYKAETACDTVGITKEDMLTFFSEYLIVQLNYLNMLCRKTQHYEHLPWQVQSDDMQQRIALFIRQHSRYPAGHKFLYIKMTQLAHELSVNRLEISIALNKMAEAERIIMRRGMIEIPALQLLQI